MGGARDIGAPLREPAVAIRSIQRFNAQVGLDPHALAAKYAVMKDSAHGFYRGNPALFYQDLHGPFAGKRELLGRQAPRIPIAGDPHLGNFGTFRGADGNPVWGLNDFDQGGTGSPEWDLERVAISASLAAHHAGLGADVRKALVEQIGRTWFETVARVARSRSPVPAPLSADEARGPVKELLARTAAFKRKDLLDRFTHEEGRCTRFLANKQLRPLSVDRAAALMAALGDYERRLSGTTKAALPLRVLDLTEKLESGGSSFGLFRYYALVAHADPAKREVILELKQLLPVPLDNQDGDLRRADGQQVLTCQRALGADLNPLNGSTRIDGYGYLVREREPEKNSIDPGEVKDAKDFARLCEQAAEALARSHAHRTGNAAALQDWVKGEADEAIARLVDFAQLYAGQTEADWMAFKAAV